VSESVIPSSTNDVQLSRAIRRSKSAECSLDDGGQVAHRPTTPITYTNLLNWRRGKPEVYVINDARDFPVDHTTSDLRRSSTGSKRSSEHVRGKMATNDEILTSFNHSSTAAVGEIYCIILYCLTLILIDNNNLRKKLRAARLRLNEVALPYRPQSPHGSRTIGIVALMCESTIGIVDGGRCAL